jgi:hypothetical protein
MLLLKRGTNTPTGRKSRRRGSEMYISAPIHDSWLLG